MPSRRLLRRRYFFIVFYRLYLFFDPASARPVGLGPGGEEVEQVDGQAADHVEAVAHERGPRPHLQEVEPILLRPAGRSHSLPQKIFLAFFQFTLCGKGVRCASNNGTFVTFPL
jgi:hypothetical protein